MKYMIYHHPLPLSDNPKSGSQIRPIKMLEAFKSIGYTVDLVVGYSSERKRSIEDVKKKIMAGIKYDFMYCENSTVPMQLADPHHLPLHPFMDFNFFQFLKSKSIPIGSFYRDIYWIFESYNKQVSFFKRCVAKFFYKYELKIYNQNLSKLYLPSKKMGKYLLPFIDNDIIDILPPGHDFMENNKNYNLNLNKRNINLFYVGGVSEYYKLDLLVKCIRDFPNIKLIICVREFEWQQEKSKYEPIPENLTVFHKSGKDLEELYVEADIAILYLEPQEYREFAVPIKLFEYVGKRKPILASKGTLAAQFIQENNIGWVIPYEEVELRDFLNSCTIHNIIQFIESMEQCAKNNSWQARATQVIYDLKKDI